MVANPDDAHAIWLPVIGKALAYLCMQEAEKKEPERFDSVLKRVRFLESLGLSRDDAAEAAGSSAKSVQELRRQQGKVRNGPAKRKRSR
jgi:hypothetical protein